MELAFRWPFTSEGFPAGGSSHRDNVAARHLAWGTSIGSKESCFLCGQGKRCARPRRRGSPRVTHRSVTRPRRRLSRHDSVVGNIYIRQKRRGQRANASLKASEVRRGSDARWSRRHVPASCNYSQSPQFLTSRRVLRNPSPPSPLFLFFSNSLAGCIACKVMKRVIFARDHREHRRLLGESSHLLRACLGKKWGRKAREMRRGSRNQRSRRNYFHVGSVPGHRI